MIEDRESFDLWNERIGSDLDGIRRRVGGWRGVVVRLAVLVDAVDELVDAGSVPDTVAGPLSWAREALVAGVDRIGTRTGTVVEEGLPDEIRRAVVDATGRFWNPDRPGRPQS